MSDQRSSSTSPPASAARATLPEYLARWAAERPRALAIRHKSHGAWAAWTWGDLQSEVDRVAAALAARRFDPGDVVAIAAFPSPQALAVTVAAQGLGGAAIWIDPDALVPLVGQSAAASAGERSPLDGAPVSRLVPAARFGFARDEATLARLHARFGSAGCWALGLFTAEHGSPADSPAAAVRVYADAAADHGGIPEKAPLRVKPSDAGFFFPHHTAAAVIFDVARSAAPSLPQAALVAGAQAWLESERIGAEHQAFLGEAPTTEAGAIFLAGWLVGGLSLGLPEDATTADTDRREMQPTIVAATGAAYGRLWQRVADNLPAPRTLLGAFVDAGLASAAGRARRAVSWWLVRRPLREVLGFRRLEVAFVLGAASLPAAARDRLAGLGVRLRALPLASDADADAAADVSFCLSAAGHSRPFEPVLALSSSSAGKVT
jgi:long-chain acyl-CoA synthetase